MRYPKPEIELSDVAKAYVNKLDEDLEKLRNEINKSVITEIKIDKKEEYDLINPTHHKGKSGMQAWDVVEEFNLTYNTGTAVSYLLRAGKKPGQSIDQDITKAIKHLERELKNINK